MRLKRPFAPLTDALGSAGSNVAAMMAERLVKTDPFKQVGRGPYRFKTGGRVPGSLVVYERNPADGRSFTDGPKRRLPGERLGTML